MRINIESIPHSEMRYDSCGDYWYDPDGTLQIRVIKHENAKYMALIMFHELIEQFITHINGIPEEEIMEFDLWHLEELKKGATDIEEPGAHPLAPYKDAHFFAETIERLIANKIRVDWNEYDKSITI